MDLNTMITTLARVQLDYTRAKDELDAKRAAWEAEHQTELDTLATLKDTAAKLNDAVRDAAVAEFSTTGNKKPHPAITVKMFTAYSYDEDVATAWALDNAPGLLVLNNKEYEKVLKTGALAGMPGTVDETPKATVARDLSEYAA